MLTIERLRHVLNYDPLTGIFTWRIPGKKRVVGAVAGRESHGYVVIGIDYAEYLAHRLAWFYVHGEWPKGKLDHDNGVRSANWIKNLRPATTQQNGYNRGKQINNTTGFKGVTRRPWGSYQAQAMIDGEHKYLGSFPTAEEAHAAYCDAVAPSHGEFFNSGD